MNTLTSSKILQINRGVAVKYSRHYAGSVCKVLLKTSPHLSECFHVAGLSLHVSVKTTGSSTWLRASQSESWSFRWLQPTACPIPQSGPECWLCASPSPFARARRPLGLRGTAHGVGAVLGLMRWGGRRWRRPFYPRGSPRHSLSLMDVLCLSCPPPSSDARSLARHPPCAAEASPATTLPAIALNSFLAFWDFACFPPLLYPTSLAGCFHSGFFKVSLPLWAY